mmetsp:Transcript_11589/g.22287  ORF Transcript_11589/g.22287 Transcript_11589/m.22287 type:complete len:87 (+) Transcript_11589:2923-3183(+)
MHDYTILNSLTGADNIGTDFLKNNIKAFINMLDDAELEKLFRQSESKEKQIKDLTQKAKDMKKVINQMQMLKKNIRQYEEELKKWA